MPSNNSSGCVSSRSSKYLAVVQSPSGWPHTRLQWCTDAAPSSQSQTWTGNKHKHTLAYHCTYSDWLYKVLSHFKLIKTHWNVLHTILSIKLELFKWHLMKNVSIIQHKKQWMVCVVLYLLKFFLLDVQHGLDPPHHLPKWLTLEKEGNNQINTGMHFVKKTRSSLTRLQTHLSNLEQEGDPEGAEDFLVEVSDRN